MSSDTTGLIEAFEFVMRYSPKSFAMFGVSMDLNWLIAETLSTPFRVHYA